MLDFDISWVDTAKKYIDAAQKLGAGSDDPLASLSFLRMMSYAEVASLAGISKATLERLVADKRGPPMVRLSARRCGFRTLDVLRWLDSREAA